MWNNEQSSIKTTPCKKIQALFLEIDTFHLQGWEVLESDITKEQILTELNVARNRIVEI